MQQQQQLLEVHLVWGAEGKAWEGHVNGHWEGHGNGHWEGHGVGQAYLTPQSADAADRIDCIMLR